MSKFEQIVTQNFDIWSSAVKKKSSVGRGSSSKIELYGVKKLRELILDLAVRGLLVPQDPNDEPASELLKKIADEKAKLIKEGQIKKEKPLEPIKDKDIPFDIPKNWEWVRLKDLGETQTGTTPSTGDSNNFGDYIPFIGPADILNYEINYNNKGLSKKGLEKSRLIKEKSIIMVCIGGSIGKSAVNIKDVACNQQVNTITPSIKDIHKMLFFTLISPFFQKKVLLLAGGSATPIINKQKWESLYVPLPPLEEQKRIVAKVDELMTLCDTLEKEQTNNIESHQTLVQVFLDSLINSKDSESFDFAWKRISDNFDLLFTTEWSIDQLKQTILQLAVMGKLVKQDPNDEPASELLKKIASEKAKLIKKEKPLEPIKEDDIPFDIPKNWEWVRLGEIVKYGSTGNIEFKDITDLETWILDLEDIEKETSKLLQKVRVREKPFQSTKKMFKKNDVLYGKLRPYLDKVIVADEDGVCTTEIVPIRAYKDIDSNFLRYSLKRPDFIAYVNNLTYGIKMPRLGTEDAINSLFPLPPLEEQKRIVAKVDELMTLCDTLKEKISLSQELQVKLAEVFTHPC